MKRIPPRDADAFFKVPLSEYNMEKAVEFLRKNGPNQSWNASRDGIVTHKTGNLVAHMRNQKIAMYIAMLHNSVPRLVYNLIQERQRSSKLRKALDKAQRAAIAKATGKVQP